MPITKINLIRDISGLINYMILSALAGKLHGLGLLLSPEKKGLKKSQKNYLYGSKQDLSLFLYLHIWSVSK